MKPNLSALAAGLLFGAGLILSGMTDPGKVKAFLDVSGRWDPSLALVMASAVAVHFVLIRLIERRNAPLFGNTFPRLTRRDIDIPLVVGAGVFGVGWGLSGVCPGPAIVNLGAGSTWALVFVAAMTVGLLAARAASAGGLSRSTPWTRFKEIDAASK